MYYSEYEKVKRMERLFEKLAYASVGLDFIVALASFLVIRGAAYSKLMLTIGGDLIMVEMAIIGVLFIMMLVLKHYSAVMRGFASMAFKNRQMRRGASTKFRSLFGIRLAAPKSA
ncbi:MAG: hypothetical protein M1528_01590 [Candidatus Marsarchaeota archaeon]|nr:hypothetical protein [Candidatus Marsarchaeota archaeon]